MIDMQKSLHVNLFLTFFLSHDAQMDIEPIPDYVIQHRARMLSVLSVVMAIIQWQRRQRHRCRKLPIKYGPLLSGDLVRQTMLDELV